jgi:hypothetical protein
VGNTSVSSIRVSLVRVRKTSTLPDLDRPAYAFRVWTLSGMEDILDRSGVVLSAPGILDSTLATAK